MNEGKNTLFCIIPIYGDLVMGQILNLIQKIFIFEEKPQKVGLTQFKESVVKEKQPASIKSKDVKLSDLMRRAG